MDLKRIDMRAQRPTNVDHQRLGTSSHDPRTYLPLHREIGLKID